MSEQGGVMVAIVIILNHIAYPSREDVRKIPISYLEV